LQKASPEYTLLILSLSSPLLLGVYRDTTLIEKIESKKKTSEALLPLIIKVMDRYLLSRIIYTRGPGSYMAIKLTYIILKTIEIVKKIPFEGCSAFALNGNKPVKAMGNLYFVKEKETIITKKIAETIDVKYSLPKLLDNFVIEDSNQPDYRLPAV